MKNPLTRLRRAQAAPAPAADAPDLPDASDAPETSEATETTEFTSRSGRHRTDLYCHECTKTFVAQLDYDLDGCHRIVCAYCGHVHFRVIKAGKVTEDRWNGRVALHLVAPSQVWRGGDGVTTQPTTTAALFLRDRWLNRSDLA